MFSKIIMFVVKVVVTIAMALVNLVVLAYKAAFVKAEEIKTNAPEYKENLRQQFDDMDVDNKFTSVFDSVTTRLSEYISSKKGPQGEQETVLLALPAPQKEDAA